MGVYEIHKYISEESDESELVSRVLVDRNETASEAKNNYAYKHRYVTPKDLIIIDVSDYYNDCFACQGEGNQNDLWSRDTPEFSANLACEHCEGSGVESEAVKQFDKIEEFNIQRLKEVQGYE